MEFIILLASLWAMGGPDSGDLAVESVLVTLHQKADVSSVEGGVIASVAVREGQQVQQGDCLVALDDRVERLAQDRAEIEYQLAQMRAASDVTVQVAQKTADVAAAELKRAEDAAQRFKKSVSDTELDQLRRAADRATLEVQQAKDDLAMTQLSLRLKENDLEAARLAVDRRKIIAPFDGTVVMLNGWTGEWVEPGQVVFRVVTTSVVRVEGFVDARKIDAAWAGRTVTVSPLDHPQSRFAGKLEFVSPEVDPVNGQVRVWAVVDNPEGLLRPGFRASMVIHARPGADPQAP